MAGGTGTSAQGDNKTTSSTIIEFLYLGHRSSEVFKLYNLWRFGMDIWSAKDEAFVLKLRSTKSSVSLCVCVFFFHRSICKNSQQKDAECIINSFSLHKLLCFFDVFLTKIPCFYRGLTMVAARTQWQQCLQLLWCIQKNHVGKISQ